MKLTVFALAAFLCSCSSTPRGWSTAQSVAGDPLSGAWGGEWVSSVNGHRGNLKCAVARKSEDLWEFCYHASWARIFGAGFVLDAVAKPTRRGRWTVEAKKDLGPLFGGEFRSVATVSDDTFSARYDSAVDRGTMTMQRLK